MHKRDHHQIDRPEQRRPDRRLRRMPPMGLVGEEVPARAAARPASPDSRRSAPAARPWPAAIGRRSSLARSIAAGSLRRTKRRLGESHRRAARRLERHVSSCLRIPFTIRSAVRFTAKVIVKQQDADQEQHAVMLGTSAASPSSAAMVAVSVRTGIEQAMGDVDGVAGGHQHRHGLAHGAADAEQDRREQAVLGRRQQHPIDQLPRVAPRPSPLRGRSPGRL